VLNLQGALQRFRGTPSVGPQEAPEFTKCGFREEGRRRRKRRRRRSRRRRSRRKRRSRRRSRSRRRRRRSRRKMRRRYPLLMHQDLKLWKKEIFAQMK